MPRVLHASRNCFPQRPRLGLSERRDLCRDPTARAGPMRPQTVAGRTAGHNGVTSARSYIATPGQLHLLLLPEV